MIIFKKIDNNINYKKHWNYSKIIYIWLASIYIFSFGVEFTLMISNCQYRFGETASGKYSGNSGKYQLICETVGYGNIIISMATPAGVQLVSN